jgi:hypothetical protein
VRDKLMIAYKLTFLNLYLGLDSTLQFWRIWELFLNVR